MKMNKKSPKVYERSNFECSHCGANDKMLAVHHSYYEKGLKPWEYPDDSLHCLCEGCHAVAQSIKSEINRLFGSIDLSDHVRVLGYLRGLHAMANSPEESTLESYEIALGFGDACDLTAEDVIGIQNNGVVRAEDLLSLMTQRSPR